MDYKRGVEEEQEDLNLNPFPVGFKNVSSRTAFVVFADEAYVFLVECNSVRTVNALAVGTIAGEYDEVFLYGIIPGNRL